MARISYRLAVALVLLIFCAAVLIQYAFLMRLHTGSIIEHRRDNWLKVPVITANPTEATSSSITSRGLSSRAQTPISGFVRLVEDNARTTDTAAESHKAATIEPQVSYSEKEAVKEGTTRDSTTRMDLKNFEVVWVNNEPKIVRKDLLANVALEKSGLTPRPLSSFEAAGGNIMFTLRTTHTYHHKRLPVLFQTWLSSVGHSKVVLVTDGSDSIIENRTQELGIEYVIAEACKSGHSQLCCKAGEELRIAFREEKHHIDWLCHVDDDMYILQRPLVSLLAYFHPRTEPVYIGRAGTAWDAPYKVRRGASLGTPGTSFHFAVGGMYCLSRAMLTRLQPYLGNGEVFTDSCLKALEPEDVTLGLVIGAVLNLTLRRTNLIHTHGLHLSTQVDPQTLERQVAVSYGFGSTQWGNVQYNAICVPGSLYAVIEDETQFKSLHCLLYPETDWCVKRKAWVEAHMGGRIRSDRCTGW